MPSRPLHDHGTRHQAVIRSQIEEDRASKAEIMSSLRSHCQDISNIIESLQIHEVRSKAKEFEDLILGFKITLPVLPLRTKTTRARLPAAQAKMKRKGKKQKGRASKAKEASAPPKMIKQAASARAGSAAHPISIGSSSCSNRSSDDGDESDSSTNDSQSDIGEYGFRHGADVGDQYGFSENDSYDSDYDYREM